MTEIKKNTRRALEPAMHGVLETRGQKVIGGGDQWFKAARDEVMEIYKFIRDSEKCAGAGSAWRKVSQLW